MVQWQSSAQDATSGHLHSYTARLTQELRRNTRVLGRTVVSPIGILCCSIILWVGTLSIGITMLLASRADAFSHAVQNSHNLTLVLERDIQRSIDLYDLSLRAVSEGAGDRQVMALPTALRNRVLFDRAATARYLGSITLRTTNGTLLANSSRMSPTHDDYRTTGSLLADFERTSGGLYIGRPAQLPLEKGTQIIPLARAVFSPEGQLLGSVEGSLSLEYFKALTFGLSIGEHGSVVIAETDGTLIARLPDSPTNIGKNFAKTSVFHGLMAGPEGYFVDTARIDGVRRLYVYRRLAGLPLIVSVAPSLSVVYAEWWERVRWFGIFILIFTVIKATGTLLFVRELRRRQHAEALLERMAHRDSLTGLENRGTFDEVLEREWKRARRDEKELCLLFIDIDRFKAYNDHYGHQAGDVALRSVAKQIFACVDRRGDHVARYGGEEFVVVLPNTNEAGAILIAERIRSAIVNLSIAHSQTPIGFLTVSIGVSSAAATNIACASDLVSAADAALYQAKGLGRNCISMVRNFEPALRS